MKKGIVGAALVIILLASFLTGCQGGRVKDLEAQNQELQAQVGQLRTQVVELEAQVGELQTQLTDKNAELDAKDARIEELEGQITGLTAELAKLPKDPSYEQLMSFLHEDKTEREQYKSHATFTFLFLKNAKAKGIQGYAVGVLLDSNRILLFAGFKTTDKGWVYILPVMGTEVKLEMGRSYRELNTTSPFGSASDVIVEIMIFD